MRNNERKRGENEGMVLLMEDSIVFQVKTLKEGS